MNVIDLAAEDHVRSASFWVAEAKQATKAAKVLALARAVASGHDPRELKKVLTKKLHASKEKSLTAEVDARLEYGRSHGTLEPAAALTIIGDAMLAGADASYLLRAAARALDTNGRSVAAFDFIQAALAIAPKGREWYRDTLALVLMNQARFDEAALEVKKVAKVDAGQGKWLGAYLTALREPATTLWLQSYVDDGVAEDAKPSGRSLAQAKQQLSLVAGRVDALAKSLRATGLALPDVSAFKPKASAFDVTEFRGVADRLLQLRIEWTRLCWLIVVLGGESLEPISKVREPPDKLSIIETLATVRFNLLLDYANGKKPKPQDQLDKDAMTLTWGGVAMPKLAPHLAGYWGDEVAATLAVVRWASGQNKSVFEAP